MKKVFSLLIIFYLFACDDNNNDDKQQIESMPQSHIEWPSLADSPWPMYRHDPQGTNRSQYPGPQIGNIDWVLEVTPGIFASEAITSFAIGSDSSIYFGSSYETPDSTVQRCVFYCIDHRGNIKWRYWDETTGYEMYSAPLVTSENAIIFATLEYIYSLNSEGTLNWKTALPYGSSDINIGMDGTIYFNDMGGNLNALSIDGDILWVKQSDDFFHTFGYGGLSISPNGNSLYVMGNSGYPQLYALNTSGDLLWYFHNTDTTLYVGPKVGTAIPIIDNDGNIYLSIGGDGLYSFTPDGNVRWKVNISAGFDQYTLDINGHIILGSNTLYSFDYSGNVFWSIESPSYLVGPIISDSNNAIYAVGSNILSFNGLDGAVLWQISVDYPITFLKSPAIGYGESMLQGYPDYDIKNILLIK